MTTKHTLSLGFLGLLSGFGFAALLHFAYDGASEDTKPTLPDPSLSGTCSVSTVKTKYGDKMSLDCSQANNTTLAQIINKYDKFKCEKNNMSQLICFGTSDIIGAFIGQHGSLAGRYECNSFFAQHDERITFIIKDNSAYELILPEYKDSDSIWRAVPTVISGRYEIGDENKLLFTSTGMHNTLAEKVGKKLNDAPGYFPTEPFILRITSLNHGELSGEAAYVSEPHFIHGFKCTAENAVATTN